MNEKGFFFSEALSLLSCDLPVSHVFFLFSLLFVGVPGLEDLEGDAVLLPGALLYVPLSGLTLVRLDARLPVGDDIRSEKLPPIGGGGMRSSGAGLSRLKGLLSELDGICDMSPATVGPCN